MILKRTKKRRLCFRSILFVLFFLVTDDQSAFTGLYCQFRTVTKSRAVFHILNMGLYSCHRNKEFFRDGRIGVYPDTTPSLKLGDAVSEQFSDRELEVLRLVVAGDTDASIAEKLFISYL